MSVMLLVSSAMAAYGKGFPVGWHHGNPVSFMVSRRTERWMVNRPFCEAFFLGYSVPWH